MKKFIILAAAFVLSTAAFSQSPQKMSYQAVVRNSSNALVTGSPVGVRISVLQGSSTGTAVFVETHTPNSNANGLVSFEIGGGTTVSGSFSGIDWANGPYFIQTETDPTGGTNYTITGTSRFLSVPYALYAETSGTPGPQGPAGATGPQGAAGESAYQVWLASGNTGTEADFLGSLVGATGPQGAAGNDGAPGAQGIQGPAGATGAQGNVGQSAYQTWLAVGNTGTESDFLINLIGDQGPTGPQGATGLMGPMGPQGIPGIQGIAGATGAQGNTGATGLSAYQVWLAAGNTGTEANFLASLVGPQGPIGNTGATGAQGIQGPIGNTGATGAQGISAYQVWLNNGHTGTEANFLASLVGATGAVGAQGVQGPQGIQGVQGAAGNNGSSAYAIWLENGNTGTEADFLAELVGAQGAAGAQGIQGAVGPMGPQGLQGPIGPLGPQGPQGPAGNNGAVGPQGPVGTFQSGTAPGEMLYWNGSTWQAVAPGTNNQTLTFCYGAPYWGTCPTLAVGMQAYGGIVAYILQPGDPGYDAGVTHGLIVAPTDLTTDALPWGPMDLVTGTGNALGSGAANTTNAANTIGSGNYAPIICQNSTQSGYTDWYLPSRDEMQKIWNNRTLFNAGFYTGQNAYYFTSSEFASAPESWVYVYDFSGGASGVVPKTATYRAHAVRSF